MSATRSRGRQIARGVLVDKRDELAGNDFMGVEDENFVRPHFAKQNGIHVGAPDKGWRAM